MTCSGCFFLISSAIMAPMVLIGLSRDLGRRGRRDGVDPSDTPLISGSGPALLGYSVAKLKDERSRLKQIAGFGATPLMAARISEINRAIDLQQTYGNSAKWSDDVAEIKAIPLKPAQYQTAVAVKIAANTWLVMGNLSAT